MPDLLSFTSKSVQTQVGNSAVLRGQGNQGAVCQASLGEYTQPTEGQRAREFFPPQTGGNCTTKEQCFCSCDPVLKNF